MRAVKDSLATPLTLFACASYSKREK